MQIPVENQFWHQVQALFHTMPCVQAAKAASPSLWEKIDVIAGVAEALATVFAVPLAAWAGRTAWKEHKRAEQARKEDSARRQEEDATLRRAVDTRVAVEAYGLQRIMIALLDATFEMGPRQRMSFWVQQRTIHQPEIERRLASMMSQVAGASPAISRDIGSAFVQFFSGVDLFAEYIRVADAGAPGDANAIAKAAWGGFVHCERKLDAIVTSGLDVETVAQFKKAREAGDDVVTGG